MTSVLVTGAGGFIGSNFVRSARGWAIDAISRHSLERAGTRWVDFEHARSGEGLSDHYDAVVHLAGNSNHGLAAQSPWLDLAATGLVAAELLPKTSADHLVVLSSAAVYARHSGQVGPTSQVDPRMPYALSKLYVEGLARSLQLEGRYGTVTIFRLYNAFGPGERSTRLIPRIASAARSGEPFRLTGSPDSLADPMHVDDVVHALLAAVDRRPDSTLDLCGGSPRRLADQITVIAEALGWDGVAVEQEPNPEEVPIAFWSDPSSTWRALGMTAEPFHLAVRRYGAEMGWISRTG